MSFCILNLLSDEFSNFERFKISRVKIQPFPCSTKKCNFYSCRKIKHKNNLVDLQNLEETKTNCTNGKDIWENIYKLCKNEKDLKILISGIQFTISVHISYNYHDLLFFYYHNISAYLKVRKYFKNFMLLFIFIRKSLFKNKQTCNFNLEIIENIIKEIGCLDCEKCQLLGSLQFYGLRSCISTNSKEDVIYAILFYKKLIRTFRMVYFLESLI